MIVFLHKELPLGVAMIASALKFLVVLIFRVRHNRRNAGIASAVLATAIPFVCPSVTRRYCVKTTARSKVQFALSDSKMCLVL